MADGRVTVETLTTRKVIRGGKEGVEKSDKSGFKSHMELALLLLNQQMIKLAYSLAFC